MPQLVRLFAFAAFLGLLLAVGWYLYSAAYRFCATSKNPIAVNMRAWASYLYRKIIRGTASSIGTPPDDKRDQDGNPKEP